MSSNLNNTFESMFTKMENFVSTKTVVGETIEIGDIVMLPLVDVSFGVGAGAVDGEDEKNRKEVGGGGLGASITPSAILVINNGNVQLVNVKNQDSLNKLIDMAPSVLSKLSSFFNKEKDTNLTEDIQEEES